LENRLKIVGMFSLTETKEREAKREVYQDAHVKLLDAMAEGYELIYVRRESK
jgi:hypothetical protein